MQLLLHPVYVGDARQWCPFRFPLAGMSSLSVTLRFRLRCQTFVSTVLFCGISAFYAGYCVADIAYRMDVNEAKHLQFDEVLPQIFN